MVSAAHPWKLVGPWYRWPRPALPADGRVAAPALQKFAGGDFINEFIAEPQHSLVFDPVIDVVSNIDLLPAAAGGNFAGKLAALFATKSDGTPVAPDQAVGDPDLLKNLLRSRLVPGAMRKLYLPTHDRHYLVSCELHCDMPGFPAVPRSEVCQAGFVLRRRVRLVPQNLIGEAALRAQAVRNVEAGLAELQQLSPLRDDLAARRRQQIAQLRGSGSFDALLAQAESAVRTARTQLSDWFAEMGIGVRVEGWFPLLKDGKPAKSLGEWRELKAQDQTGDSIHKKGNEPGEQFHPLYPLIADPRDPKHDAAGRTMYYGLVPTTSFDHDASGRARLDDVNTYEIRCFVRRHDAATPRPGKTPDCCGEVVWSLPTEPFRIAATFDTLGTANRPITIKMPDLRELAAQVAARPRGALSPVKFIQPQHLKPKAQDGAASGGDMGGNAICFFSIPLITIIALFVLNLFLPIVVFIFNLWFLLILRFCIPPQVKFGADLDLALAATPPGVDFDADFAVTVGGTALLAVDLNDQMKANLEAGVSEEIGENMGGKFDAFSNNALAPLNQSFADNSDMAEDDNPDNPPRGLDYGSGLVYEPHRDPVWRLEGGRG